MPYKIVQTVERGKKSLVVVPSFWEDNGKLWWPPKKSLFKFMRDEHSKPSKEWKVMKCILKRTNMLSYQLADEELSVMQDNSDTDVQDTAVVELQEIIVMPNQNQEINFELLANDLTCKQENQENTNLDNSSIAANENVTNNENDLQVFNAEHVNFDLVLTNQNIISEKIDNMLQIQEVTLNNQRKIIQELAKHSVQLEEMTVQLTEIKQDSGVTLLKDANPVDNESFSIKPIDNQKELILLDQLLADKTEKKKLRQHLSFLCTTSNGSGITCAYKLLDIIFTRDFLCFCSWAGGSRGDRSKIALKDYKNVLKFFHTMIQTWDPTYTVQDNEKFFKIVTKNSMQRKCMKNLRTSSKRCRKKKDNLNEQQKTSNEKQSIEKHASNDDAKKTEQQTIEKENISNDSMDEYDLC